MSRITRMLNSGSEGGAKIWITIIVTALALFIYVITIYAPIVQTTWDVEDMMWYHMRRLEATGEEQMYQDLQDRLDKKEIGIQVYDDCTFEGEVGEEGKFVCKYTVPVSMFGGRYKRVDTFKIVSETSKIPDADVH